MLQMGFIIALSVLTRVFALTLIPVFALFIVWRLYVSHAGMKKVLLSMAGYMGPVIIAIMVILILNYVRFGGMFKSGYHTEFDADSFSTPFLKGLKTYFFTAQRSIFIFAPPLLAALLGAKAFIKKHKEL